MRKSSRPIAVDGRKYACPLRKEQKGELGRGTA
jgi:hypothetical protein